MNTKQLINKLLKNWFPITICLCLALLIYTFHQFSLLDKRTFTIPLSVEAEGNLTPSVKYDRYSYVRVTVRAKKEQLASVTDADLKAKIIVSGETKEGSYKIPVVVECAERLMLMEPLEIKTNPEYIPITLEEKIIRYVDVKPSFSGTPAHGFQIAETKVKPETVMISGPRSMVEAVNSIQSEEIRVEGLSQTFTSSKGLVNLNKLISLDKNAKFDVTVTFSQSDGEIVLNSIPVTLLSLSSDLEAEGNLPSVSLVLSGKQLQIERYTKDNVKFFVDLSNVKEAGTYELPVSVSGVKQEFIKSFSPETVSLSLISKKSVQKELSPSENQEEKASESENKEEKDSQLKQTQKTGEEENKTETSAENEDDSFLPSLIKEGNYKTEGTEDFTFGSLSLSLTNSLKNICSGVSV